MTAKEAANMLGVAESTVQKATKYKNGTFLRMNGYSVYIPDDVDQNTSAFIYYPGAGGAWPNDASQLDKYIAGGNANQIIFITDISRDSRYMNGKYFMQEIEKIGEANGVEITNVDCMGFSAGGPAVYSTLVSLASQSEEPGGHAAILNDVVGFSISNSDIQALVKDESRVMILEPGGTIPSFASTLAGGGVDVVVVGCSGSHGAHVTINRDILSNGIINLLSGDAEALNDVSYYTFRRWDPNKKTWVTMSVDEVYEKFNNAEFIDSPFRYYKKLSKLGDLESNNPYIKQTINEMRALIKNSDFLSNTSFTDSYSSTTQIPNGEGEIIQSFFTECANLLHFLEKDTVAIVKIGDGIAELDKSSSEEASKLNDSVKYYDSTPVSTYTPTYTPTYSTPTTPTYVSTPVDTTQSPDVNVDLKPVDLTEDEYKALFASDGSGEGNAKAVWNFLKAKGLSDAAAAGVLGNIQAECNFRLTAVGDNGTSYGLIQWHAGRWTKLKEFCASHNLKENSLQGQLEYLWYESLNPESSYGKSLAKNGFYSTNSPVDAAVAFHNVVERSASTQDVVRSKRGGFANSWYDKYKGTKPETSSTKASSTTTTESTTSTDSKTSNTNEEVSKNESTATV